MKLSTQAIVLCTVLVAAATLDVTDASDRKLIRNNKRRGTERKRNLIKVDSALEELVQIDEAELARALMGSDMSMSMPSNGGGSNTGSGSGSDGKSDSGSDTSGSDTSDGGSDTSDGGSAADGSDSGDVPTEAPVDEAPPSAAGDIPPPEPFDPQNGTVGAAEEESSAPSRRSLGVAAIATTVMVVPLLF